MTDPFANFEGLRFRKRPIEVSAVHYHGDIDRGGFDSPPPSWLVDALNVKITKTVDFYQTGKLSIATLGGTMYLEPGDWIVRGIKGELYPVKPDIFAETYEAV